MADEKLPSLYHVTAEFLKILEAEEYDEAALDAAATKLETKAGNIAGYTQMLRDQAEALKKHEERIREHRQVLENKRQWLLAYLQQNMELAGVYKIQWKEHRISLAKNPPSCLLTDERELPLEFLKPQPDKPDKQAILEALKQGKKVPGAQIAPPTFNLRIK